MDDDGMTKIVAATDVQGEPQPRFSVYELGRGHFDQIAYVDLVLISSVFYLTVSADGASVALSEGRPGWKHLAHQRYYEREAIAFSQPTVSRASAALPGNPCLTPVIESKAGRLPNAAYS